MGWAVNATTLHLVNRPDIHFMGDWAGPRAGLEESGKISPPLGFELSSVQPVAIRYTHKAIPAHVLVLRIENFRATAKENWRLQKDAPSPCD